MNFFKRLYNRIFGQKIGARTGVPEAVGLVDETDIRINPATEENQTALIDGKYITIVDNGDTTTDIVYVGLALPTTATSAASWQIQEVDKTTDVITVKYADGNTNFDNIWDDRDSLSYS